MLKYFILIRIYKYRILSIILAVVLIIAGLELLNDYVSDNNQEIGDEYAYYSGTQSKDLIDQLDDEVLYEMGMPIAYEKSNDNKYDYTIIDQLDNSVDLSSLQYLDSTSESLISQNRNSVINGIVELKFSLKYLDIPSFVMDEKFNISSAELQLLSGQLPKADQVIVPETYALSLINGEGTLEDVIGQDITLKKNNQEKEYRISGVSNTNNFYVSDPEAAELIAPEVAANRSGLYLKFPSEKAKEKFIEENLDIPVLDNHVIKNQNIITYVLVVLKIILFININLYLFNLAFKLQNRINYYSNEKLILLKLLVVPLLVCNSILILI